jgi:hypothetical protein
MAGFYGIYQAANPVDAKLIEEEKKRRRPSQSAYEPMVIGLPYLASNDRPVLYNFTPMFEVTKYLAGDPTLGVAERVVGNALINFTNRGVLGDATQDYMATLDPRWEQHERKKKVWESGWAAAADKFLGDSGLVWKLPTKMYRQYRSTQPQPFNPYSTNQQQPLGVVAPQMAGLPVLPQQNPLAPTMQMHSQMSRIPQDIRSRLLEPEGFQRGPVNSQNPVGEDIQSIFQYRMPKK